MKNKLTIATRMIFILFFFASSCKSGRENKATKETGVLPDDIVELRSDQQKMAGVQLGQICARPLNGILKVNGTVTVAPQDLATICAPLGGFIRTTSLLPGNPVSKGQVLAVIENQEFIDIQQDYLEAKNKLEFAEAEFSRHSELYKEDVYSRKNLQQVTAEYRNLKTKVKALEQKLGLIGIDPSGLHENDISRTVAILSPITGYVRAVNINIGKYVNPSDVMFEIVNSDRLLLELVLFEKDAGKVHAGQKLSFYINNESEQHEAFIYQTSKSIDTDKTYKIYATVSGSCKNVIPGMYVNALIESESKQSISVPSESVVSFDDKDYIFVFNRNKTEGGSSFTEFRMIRVQRGIEDNGFTEIGLPDGFDIKSARVVVKGAYNLLSARKNAGEMAC